MTPPQAIACAPTAVRQPEQFPHRISYRNIWENRDEIPSITRFYYGRRRESHSERSSYKKTDTVAIAVSIGGRIAPPILNVIDASLPLQWILCEVHRYSSRLHPLHP